MKKRKKNPTGIMIHCSDSSHGDKDLIKKWHTSGNGWEDIGYNWIITNGCRLAHKYKKENDGIIEKGRDVKYAGAHARGYNESHLGICLVGSHHFTPKQFESLFELLRKLQTSNLVDYFIPGCKIRNKNILGHYEVNKNKTCPNIDMEWLRQQIDLNLNERK